MDFSGGCLNSIMTVGPQFLPEGATTPSSKSPFPIETCIILRQKGNNGACASQMPSIHSDRSEHHIRDVSMWFLLLNKEKSHHRGLSLWVRHELLWDAAFGIQSSLQSRPDIPTVSGKEPSLPHYCWLRSSFKSVSGNNNKIFIKLCIQTMSGHSQQPTIFF